MSSEGSSFYYTAFCTLPEVRQLVQIRTLLITPLRFNFMFCKFGNCRLLVFPVIYLFFPLLSLLPVLDTDNDTVGRFPQIKHTFDIFFSSLIYCLLIKSIGYIILYDRNYKNSITRLKFQVFFSQKL